MEMGIPFRMKRNIFLRLFPWLVAIGIFTVLLLRIPMGNLKSGLSKGPMLSLSIYVFFQVVIVLLLDAFATSISLAVTGIRHRFPVIFLARGTTYLVGVLNYAIGQGALGVFLHRIGARVDKATGALFFMVMINVGVLMLVTGIGFLVGGLPNSVSRVIFLTGLILIAGMIIFFIVAGMFPRLLTRYPSLAPLWDAGLRGHMLAVAGRFPHVLILVLTHWGAMRLWGIAVPLPAGMVLIPAVLFIASLPITPAGLGSIQGVHVVLFSPYVHALTPEARAAEVLAYSLVYYFLGIAFQVLLGLFCWEKLRRMIPKPTARG